MPFTLKNLTSLVQVAMQHGASDIHIRMGESPCLRIAGELVPVQTKTFDKQDVVDICKILFDSSKIIEKLGKIKEYDGGYEVPGLCRLRFNYFRFNDKIGIILRLIKNKIPTIDELNLAPILKKISLQNRGLVLVTGATGSGKSTTLAAMLNYINTKKHAHVISIEDPIEYIHPQIKSRITQREVGTDTDNFSNGLRAALRQDPDIILIGEMRDVETIQTALKAAETGHLVLATVHTTNAISTIGRIISMFPAEEQLDVRKRLAENLHSTISQRMLKNLRGKGVVIAQEIMINGPGVKECITGDEPIGRIIQIIREGRGEGGSGSQSFDQHIMDLFQAGLITKEVATNAVDSQSDFLQSLQFE